MTHLVERVEPRASFHHAEFAQGRLLEAKGPRRVTVCIPARDEGATIASIVSTIRAELSGAGRQHAGEDFEPGRTVLVDEVLVVDDCSSDDTAEAAARAGAVVMRGPGRGKGEAMGLARGRADIVVYLDGDVVNFAAHYVTGLLGPLLLRPGTVMVKGRYERSAGGGRVTELVAKPLLSLLFPELAWLNQPLAGETAICAEVLEHLELAPAYGVEIALLIDVGVRFGPAAIAEVDLGERVHRNRPLHELASQARDVMKAALSRSARGDQLRPFLPEPAPGSAEPGAPPARAGAQRAGAAPVLAEL